MSMIPEREGDELDAVAAVELVLELHPVQAQRVQEGRQTLHDQEHGDGQHSPHSKGGKEHVEGGQSVVQHHLPQHLGELT